MNLHQTGLVMRLSILFLTVGFLNASAGGFSQTITLRVQNAPLEKVFHEIEKQSGYSFLYEKGLLQKARPVSLEVSKASVDQVLGLCFANQALMYSIIEKVVVVKEKEERRAETYSVAATPPVGEVRGRITNPGGEPLANASIVIKRNGVGVQTDANGIFTLKNATPDDIIIISYTGYQQQVIKINARSNLTLVMEVATNELDEAVVQAYGTTTRRLATGNIGRVTEKEIDKQPIMNPLMALQGRVAGLAVTQVNGFTSAPIKVELRGRSAIGNFPSDPMYIVDGVPLTVLDVGGTYYGRGASFLQSGAYNGPANGQSPLFSINPADIQSIEVLKDADATSIYGSRGANGVILITTKKGKPGKTKLDINIQQGINRVSRFWKMLNTQQYVAMRKEAFKNDGITPTLGNAYDLLVWDTMRYTDWQKAIYGGTGKNTNVQIALSGGDARTNFRFGAGYNNTTNILAVSGADQRASVSFNLNHQSPDQRFTISFTNTYSFSQSDMIQLPGSVTYTPNAPSIYDSLGNLNYAGWAPVRNQFPFAGLKQPYTSKTNFLNSNLVFSYQPLRGLRFSTNIGYNSGQANQAYFRPISSQDPATNPTGSAIWGNNNNKNWLIEPQISYDAFIAKGKLSTFVGWSLQETKTDGLAVTGSGYTNDDLLRTISNAPIQTGTDNYGEYRYNAIFGRITYNLRNEYIINFNGRRDGSSKFGPGSQFGNFGSIGAAWIFTESDILKGKMEWLSFGKLRASYGTTGSDAVGDYKYLTRWSSNGTQLYNGIQPLQPLQHSNPQYQWQVNKKLEGGIDIGLLKDRITISVVWYRNRCGNQLIDFPVPAYTGFTTVTANSPALVENKGWEITSYVHIINQKNFKWGISFNTAFNQNKLVSYPNFEKSPFTNIYVVGQPLNITKLLQYTGVDPQTGLYTFVDKNKDGIISTNPGISDDRYVYNLNPKFFGGFGMDFSYKNTFQISLFFNAVKQIGANAIGQGSFPGTISNQPVGILENHWQKTGDLASLARYTTQPKDSDFNFKFQSDGGYTDASFIRLSNLSIAYNVPTKLVKKLGMQQTFRLFFNANNVFVITKYKGIDPETQNFGGMPPSKTFVGGINFNF